MLILALSITLLCSCVKKDEKFTDNRIAMGTSVSITVYEREDKAFIEGVFNLLYDIEREISAKLDSSYISMINSNAGVAPVQVPSHIFSLIETAMWISSESGGYFNPAIGALSDIWAIGSENQRVPSQTEIESVLPLLSLEDIVLDSNNSSVYLKKPGMKLDLGGIGKGYAADEVRAYLVENGVDRAIINLGGNIYALGSKSEKELWKIGIMNPEESGSYISLVEVEDKSVVTSGAYERFFEEDGVIYHHILNPDTGYPYESDLLSASIIAESSTLADGLSTVVFASGSEHAEEIANKFGVSIILYTKDREIITYGEL